MEFPEVLVKKSVECAVECQAGRSLHPPRHEQVCPREKLGRGPSKGDRQNRKEKRNNPPFVGICTVAVHTRPDCAFPPSIAAGRFKVEAVQSADAPEVELVRRLERLLDGSVPFALLEPWPSKKVGRLEGRSLALGG